MDLITLVLFLVILGVAAFFLLAKDNKLPPGPWMPIPFIGFAPKIIYALYRGDPPLYKLFVKLGQKYGSVFSFTALGKTVVVLNELQAIREAFQDPKLSNRMENKLTTKMIGRSIIKWEDTGPYRSFYLGCFRKFGIGTSRFEEPISIESSHLIEELVKLQGEPVDLTWHFNNAVSNIICKVAFGTRFELSDARFHRLTGLVNNITELQGSGGLEIVLPFPSKKKQEIIKNTDELSEFINNMIEEHRKNFDPDNSNDDIIDMHLSEERSCESDDPNSWRYPKNMTGQIFLLFLGGSDTVANTLRWATQYLTRYPEIQQNIHREIDGVVGRDRLPRLADKSTLHFTQAVLAEIHRIVTLVPLSAFHVAGDRTTFRGYTITKGTILISNLYAVMHDPGTWKEPEEFRPERFLGDDGKFQEPAEVIPFGVGRRICLGEALARQELFVFFSHLLHQFKFEKTYVAAPAPSLTRIDGIISHPEPYQLRVIQRE